MIQGGTQGANNVGQPIASVFDAAGNLFLGFSYKAAIVVIPAPGVTSIYGQTVTPSQPVNLTLGGSLTSLLGSTNGFAFDNRGNMFISDSDWGTGDARVSHQITVIPASGVTSIFGQTVTPNQPVILNPGTSGSLHSLLLDPGNLSFDSSGSLYIPNAGNRNVVVIPAPGVTSIYGQTVTPSQPVILNPGTSGSLSSLINGPQSVVVDSFNNLFVSNGYSSGSITVIPASGVTSIFGQTVTPNQPVILNPGTSGSLSSLISHTAGMVFMSDHTLLVGGDGNFVVAIPASGVTSIFGQTVTPNQPVILNPGNSNTLAALLFGMNQPAIDNLGNLVLTNRLCGNVATIGVGCSFLVVVAAASGSSSPVTYANGGGMGTLPTQSALASAATFTVAVNTLTKSGYNFAGWSDGTNTYQPGATYTMASSAVTLTAIWTTPPIVYSKPTSPSSVSALMNNGTATVSFNPGSSGNLPTYNQIDMYINGQPVGNVCNVTGATSCPISNLGPNATFTFTVTAVNSKGSATSAVSNAVSYASPTTVTPTTTTTTTTMPPAKQTITCVKGKITKKVTAVSPVCPSGYMKK